MASTRSVSRLVSRAATATRPTLSSSPRASAIQAALRNGRRGYSQSSNTNTSSNTPRRNQYLGYGAIAAAGLIGGYIYSNSKSDTSSNTPRTTNKLFTPTKEDYQKVYNHIAALLAEHDNYDDGSYGPVLVRLAWHASGTYDAATNTGGSNGATMRFAPESDHGANSGLKAARDFLDPVKKHFPWISYSDLWTLGGVAAVQEMQGPAIPWRPGRQDRDVAFCTPDGRLPDASKDAGHIRAIFGRMGFNDQEMVALSGAHALGRCHTDRSGFEGPWTFSPTVFSNDYYTLLFNEKWNVRKWNGPKQYQDKTSKSLMMLPTDLEIINDKEFRKTAQVYAKDAEKFYQDFAAVYAKLLELGVPFKQDEKWTFQPTV